MKKTLLLGLFFGWGAAAMAQNTPVSQTVKKKKVLIEEFTGINCNNCPQGHYLMGLLQGAYPNKIVPVNVHAGYFAEPSTNQPDFRTEDGNALVDWMNPQGFPMGPVQRRNQGGTIVANANDWQDLVVEVSNENSPVNIAIDANINEETRVVTVKVELFYTSDFPANTKHYLNVGILQDNYVGFQYNPNNYNPNYVMGNNSYKHMHMFRGYINTSGTWGDEIDATQNGVITKTYTYTLPQDINGIDLDIQNLEFYATIGEGHNDVTNSNIFTVADTEPTFGSNNNNAGIEENEIIDRLLMFPNPASDVLYLTFESIDEYSVSIVDLTGKEVFTGTYEGANNKISTANFQKGTYVVKVSTKEQTISKLLIKE